jgi:hypothetical protein
MQTRYPVSRHTASGVRRYVATGVGDALPRICNTEFSQLTLMLSSDLTDKNPTAATPQALGSYPMTRELPVQQLFSTGWFCTYVTLCIITAMNVYTLLFIQG